MLCSYSIIMTKSRLNNNLLFTTFFWMRKMFNSEYSGINCSDSLKNQASHPDFFIYKANIETLSTQCILPSPYSKIKCRLTLDQILKINLHLVVERVSSDWFFSLASQIAPLQMSFVSVCHPLFKYTRTRTRSNSTHFWKSPGNQTNQNTPSGSVTSAVTKTTEGKFLDASRIQL